MTALPDSSTGTTTLYTLLHDLRNPDKWARFVARYTPRIYRWMYGLCKSCGHRLQDQDAKDILQEVLVKLYRGLDRFDPTQPFNPWLKAVVNNAARDFLKKKARRVAGIHCEDWDRILNDQAICKLTNEIRRVTAIELLNELVDKARKKRPNPRDWEVFWLIEKEGLTHKEVAAKLGLSPANVGKIQFRNLECLQALGAAYDQIVAARSGDDA